MAGCHVRRTAITRLSVTAKQRKLLEKTLTEWRSGCQLAADLAWEQGYTTSDIQTRTYDTVRERTALGSQHTILAIHQAAAAINGCDKRRSANKSVSKPRFTAPTMTFDSRTMTLFDDETVSLTTIESRVRCSLVLPDTEDGYQQQYLKSDEWSLTESTLTVRDGEFFLHLGFRRQRNDTERSIAANGTVLGVDLGIENLAVTSTARFFNGRELAHRLREFETVRGGLQQTGTRSAYRTLTRSSGRERRYIRDVLHRTANGIISEAVRYGCHVIAFEDLTEIREQTGASWGHRWAFRTLYEFVEYKAEALGITVARVDPAYTSTRCAECGYTANENRPTRNRFQCEQCESQSNADYNAAKNIGLRYVRRGQQSSRRTGNGQLALKSGTVTPNDGFTAYSDGYEAAFTDKPSAPPTSTTQPRESQ
ncbi:MAG: RNA-guided endonuclease InsQ/TnpB family protein [Halohasta sp.]